LYFSYIKDYKGTIEVKKAIFFFETIQNLYIKGKSAGKPLKTNKLTILPSEKKNKRFGLWSNCTRRGSKLVWDQSGFGFLIIKNEFRVSNTHFKS